MSEHREWNAKIVWHDESLTALMNEHNATVCAYRYAMAECDRLGRANDEACDRVAELERDISNAVKNAMDRLPDAPWKDKTATEAVWLLSLAVAAPIRVPFSAEQIERMAKAANDAYSNFWISKDWPKLDFPREQHWKMWEEEGDTMKQSRIAMIRAALAAGGLEPCAVSERASDDELAELCYDIDASLNRPCEWSDVLPAVRARVEAPLLAEIQRLDIENRDRAFYVREFAAVSQERDTLKARVAELEAGKAGWCERDRGNMLLEMSGLRDQLAALRQPVDPDAWKMPLFLDACGDEDGDEFAAIENSFRIIHTGEFNWEYSAADAARAAQWLASYAAAHGCQVGPLAIEPIASPDVLEQLVVIGWKARSDAAFCEGGTIDAGNLAQVAAILRAAQAYVDVTPDEVIKVWNEHLNDEVDPAKVVLALLDSRIRYRVSPPETPNAQMQRCIDRKNRHIDALKAIVKKWKAKGTETPQGLPTREELAWAINAAWRKHCKYPPNPLGTAIPEEWDAQADAALEYLCPFLHEPTGWELDVTAKEVEDIAWEERIDCRAAKILDLCRSRIRPTFECGECAARREAMLNSAPVTCAECASRKPIPSEYDLANIFWKVDSPYTNQAWSDLAAGRQTLYVEFARAARAALEGE